MSTNEYGFLAGFLLGLGTCGAIWLVWAGVNKLRSRKKVVPTAPVVDENTAIKCGACMSFIRSKPIFANIASPKSFKVYRCEQCSTEVSIEF